MSELASMAANKSSTTNNNVTNNIISTSNSSSPAQQSNSPVLSSTSSLVSPDSSATNPISSPEAQTPQNTPQTNSPLTTAMIADETDNNVSESTTPTNQIISSTALVDASSSITSSTPIIDNNNISKSLSDDTKCDSPLIDTKSSGSVHEKASMFERKLSEEQQSTQANAPIQHHHPNPLSLLNNSTLNLTPATVARLESIYGKKTEEIYGRTSSTTSLMERVVETGQFFFFNAFILLPHAYGCVHKFSSGLFYIYILVNNRLPLIFNKSSF